MTVSRLGQYGRPSLATAGLLVFILPPPPSPAWVRGIVLYVIVCMSVSLSARTECRFPMFDVNPIVLYISGFLDYVISVPRRRECDVTA